MTHLPGGSRRELEQSEHVERVMADQRLQPLRSRTARRWLAVATAALCIAILPSFALGGPIIGSLTAVAAATSWWLLRKAIREIADLPERFLDERQRSVRDHAYVYAYLILGWLVAGLVTIGLVALAVVMVEDSATLRLTWDVAVGAGLTGTLLISALPSVVIAWRDAGENGAARQRAA